MIREGKYKQKRSKRQKGRSAPLENNRINSASCENIGSSEANDTLRIDLNRLRSVASRIAINHSVKICDHYTHDGSDVEAWRRKDGKMSYKNLIHCGSVWACPVCRWKIQTYRRDELRLLNLYAENDGYYMGWLTLTISHKNRGVIRAKSDIKAMSKAFDRAKNCRKNKKIAKEIDFQYVRVLETMYGKDNGFHPHYHIIVYGRDKAKLRLLVNGIIYEWLRVFEDATIKNQVYKEVYNSTDINNQLGDYVTKYQIMHEATNAKNNKKGYSKDRINPLTTLELIYKKDYTIYTENELENIYNQYIQITKRMRSLQYSRGFKARYITEKTDEEILNDVSQLDLKMLIILESVWRIIVNKEKRGELLNMYEKSLNKLNRKDFVKWVSETVGRPVTYDMQQRLYISGVDIKSQMTKRKALNRKKDRITKINPRVTKTIIFHLNAECMNRLINYKDVASLTAYSVGHSKRLLAEVRNAKDKKRITLKEFLEFHKIDISSGDTK